jgi:TolB-like protein
MRTHIRGGKNHGYWHFLVVGLVLFMPSPTPTLAQELRELKDVSSKLAPRIAASGRKTIAVVDFTDLQGNVTELGRYLAEELSGDMFEEARGFRVIDRSHLRAILQEHKLASTGLIDPQTARQLGQFAGVDTLVTGTITSAFGDTVRVMVKALDVSTAEMIAESSVSIPKTDAIKSLLGQGVQAGSSGGDSPNPGAGVSQASESKSGWVSAEDNSLLFVLKTCKRSGESLSCQGSVTWQGRGRTQLTLGQVTTVDNLGNESREYSPPIFGSGQSRSELEPDLPYNFQFRGRGVDPSATAVTVTIAYGKYPYGMQSPMITGPKITLRKVPIR